MSFQISGCIAFSTAEAALGRATCAFVTTFDVPAWQSIFDLVQHHNDYCHLECHFIGGVIRI